MIRGTVNLGTQTADYKNPIRQFETGATRDTDTGKLDFDGFLSPLVLRAYAEYMHKHRHLPDGSLRPSDNWTLGISPEVYMKSLWRHFFATWEEHRGITTADGLVANLCAVLFNASGMLHEFLKDQAKVAAIPQTRVDHFWNVMEATARRNEDFKKEDQGSGV